METIGATLSRRPGPFWSATLAQFPGATDRKSEKSWRNHEGNRKDWSEKQGRQGLDERSNGMRAAFFRSNPCRPCFSGGAAGDCAGIETHVSRQSSGCSWDILGSLRIIAASMRLRPQEASVRKVRLLNAGFRDAAKYGRRRGDL